VHPSPKLTPGKRLIWRRSGALLLIALGLALLAGSGWLAVNRLVIGQGNMTVPTSLAGLPLSRQTTGQAALTEIEQLHRKAFPMVNGVVAHYGEGRTTLWISSTWLPFMAARQVEVMTKRIAEGRSPFTPSGIDEVEGVNIYALTGMGQTHYYVQLDRRVIWLAVSPQLAEPSLAELIRKLR
jgi:hypothetical protein